MRALMWFRADLRISDNRALSAACRKAGRDGSVIAVFLIAAEQWREHDWAGVKVDLILRSLKVLSADLAELNIPLMVRSCPRFAGSASVLSNLAREHACDELYFNREYEVNELRRDEAVARAFAGMGLKVRAFDDQIIMPPGGVRTGQGEFYTVFTPFKKACYKLLGDANFMAEHGKPVARPSKVGRCRISADKIPDRVKELVATIDPAIWPAGEHAARRRLEKFVSERILRYKAERDFPAEDATSVLSPYLAIGCVSPRECLASALEVNRGKLEHPKEDFAGPNQWISELFWREFYRQIMIGFPRVSKGRAFKAATERIRWSNNRKEFEQWQSGQTGVPIVDAGMRQLKEIGWMHNRLRMITAMFLTKDLFIDWRCGEQHFMRHLVDGDLAQNNGGWQWAASTGTDAAPYFRIFNPISQSRRFDPEGRFIRRYVHELAELKGGKNGPIHDPAELQAEHQKKLNYPKPIVDHAKSRARVMEAFSNL